MHRLSFAIWLLLLILPSVTSIATLPWEASPWQLLVITLWIVSTLAYFLERRLFLIITYPFVLIGTIIVGAELLRAVNLISLLATSQAYSSEEIFFSIKPYKIHILLIVTIVTILIFHIWKNRSDKSKHKYPHLALFVVGTVLFITLPFKTWIKAWPMTLVAVATAKEMGNKAFIAPFFSYSNTNPRDPLMNWDAYRSSAQTKNEVYVLVIGESIRSDRIPGCGGRAEIWNNRSDALLYCDVIAGANSTTESVPLLISREMPGHDMRISNDATFIKAFEQVGFETFWLSVQDRSIAWPDSKNLEFNPGLGLDNKLLLPMLDKALSNPSQRKLIILHANNAHIPYSSRYTSNTAIFPVNREGMADLPTRSKLKDWWNDYDNAVHESLSFFDEIIKRVEKQKGHVFVMFTPDHGENMLDDNRDLVTHALIFPTKWDTHVPALIWANTSWRKDSSEKWKFLVLNQGSQLMHMDLIPTILGAANIHYTDNRKMPIDLTSNIAHSRKRIVQRGYGEPVDFDAL